MESSKSNRPLRLGLQRNLSQKVPLHLFSQSKHYEKLVKVMHCHNCPTYTINNHWWHHKTEVCNTDRTKRELGETGRACVLAEWISFCIMFEFSPTAAVSEWTVSDAKMWAMTSLPVSFWVDWSFNVHWANFCIVSKNPSFDIIHGEHFIFPSPLTWMLLQVRGK